MSYIIKDIRKTCHKEFLNAHHSLQEIYRGLTTEELRIKWLEDYNIEIVKGVKSSSAPWQGMIFENEEHYLYFKLKWS